MEKCVPTLLAAILARNKLVSFTEMGCQFKCGTLGHFRKNTQHSKIMALFQTGEVCP
jgi:hypothetical protein